MGHCCGDFYALIGCSLGSQHGNLGDQLGHIIGYFLTHYGGNGRRLLWRYIQQLKGKAAQSREAGLWIEFLLLD